MQYGTFNRSQDLPKVPYSVMFIMGRMGLEPMTSSV